MVPEELLELLRDHIGLAHDSIGTGAVEAALRARSATGDLEGYIRLIRRDPAELELLFEELVVPETWFMRDEAPFPNMIRVARDRLARSDEVHRVLCMPCSTGEEPYSIVIAWSDAGLPLDRLRVDAIDLSRNSLAQAARACYSEFSFRGTGASLREDHFENTPDGWVLAERLRERVSFHHGNLVSKAFLPPLARYDTIFCRNLLIYLTREARQRVLDLVCSVLEPDGILVVGHAEVLETFDGRFRRRDASSAFTYGRGERRTISRTLAAKPTERPKQRARTPDRPSKATFPSRLPVRSAPIHPDPSPNAAVVAPSLEVARALADRGEIVEAAALCEQILTTDATADGFFLLGVIRTAEGATVRAREAFSRAAYLEPRHVETLRYLAELADQAGNSTEAANFRRRLLRAQRAEP